MELFIVADNFKPQKFGPQNSNYNRKNQDGFQKKENRMKLDVKKSMDSLSDLSAAEWAMEKERMRIKRDRDLKYKRNKRDYD